MSPIAQPCQLRFLRTLAPPSVQAPERHSRKPHLITLGAEIQLNKRRPSRRFGIPGRKRELITDSGGHTRNVS